MTDLVIRNGTVVTAGDTFQADVAISGGKIAAMGQGLSSAETLDASGLLVMPGGVDPHVHLQYPQGRHRVVSSDDWLTGTIAAACGGTTTLLDFVEAGPDETWLQAFDKRLAEAEPQAVIDYGFHMSFNRADERSLAEVRSVIEAGMPSFKIYMAYAGLRLNDAEMLLALATLKREGGLPIVHAENHDVIMHLTERHLAAGHVEPRWHPRTRPAAAEAEATYRALALAEVVDVPLHIVHVSARQGLEAIRSQVANRKWQASPITSEMATQPECPSASFGAFGKVPHSSVTGEVAIQHLLLTESLYEQPGFEPAKYVMAPPLRSAADAEAMWQGLHDGSLDFVVTDHCPFTLAQKGGQRRTAQFRRLPGAVISSPPESSWSESPPPFNQIPGGVPGVETRLALVYHFGVNQRRLSLNQFVAVTSTAAARLFGLYPQKGTIAPGADADLVLFDPDREVTITANTLHQNCDYTPYEGFRVKGWPTIVLGRGEVIVRDGEFVGAPGRGRFLKRGQKS